MNRVLVFAYVLAVLAVLAFSSMLGRDLIDYRDSELDFLLEQAAELEESTDTLSIVGKYELIRRRIESGEGTLENYSLEARTVALSAQSILSGLELQHSKTLLPVALLLKPIHFVMGKSTITPTSVGQQANLIEIAYYWERNRKYSQAVESYEFALSTRTYTKPDVVAAILLHQGFCHSMLNQYSDARICFQAAIERYPETDAGILAWKLIDFLDSLEARRRMVDTGELDAFAAGRQAYFLMDYRGSIEDLQRYVEETGEGGYIAEARYFKARSHEELGEINEALAEYEALIGQEENRRWAVEAGRRIYMLGVYYGQQQRISEESKTQVAALGDLEFLDAVSLFAGPESESFARSVVRGEEIAVEEAVAMPPGEAAEEAAEDTAVAAAELTQAEDPAPEETEQAEAFDPLERLVSLLEPQKPEDDMPQPLLGTLVIENREAGLNAYLDGLLLGRVGQGTFESIEPGEYRLDLRGDGRNLPEGFGSAEVSIAAGESSYVFVEPIPYGRIDYRIPDGATAVVEGSHTRIPVTGEGMLRFFPVGVYRVEVTFPGYPLTQETITLDRNQTVNFFPSVPSDTGSGVIVAGRQLETETPSPAESPLPTPEPGSTVRERIAPSPISAEQRNRELRINQLSAERTALVAKIDKAQKRSQSVTRGQWISYGTGLAALGGMGASLYLGSQSYQAYRDALYTDEAVALRQRTLLLQGIAIGTGVLGGLGIAGGTVLLAINPNLERLQRRVDRLDVEIEKLEQDMN